jgi:hypothetical protein
MNRPTLVGTDSTPSLIALARLGTRVERVPTRFMVAMRGSRIVEAFQEPPVVSGTD